MSEHVWAIVLNWNNYSDASEAIISLLNGTVVPERVLLVDNGSEDDSLARLRSDFATEARVEFLQTGDNLGFARGMGVGIERALKQGADAVLLFNNDAVAAPTCLERLLEGLRAHPGAGMVAPRIFFHADPQRVWQGGGEFRRWKAGPVVSEKNRLASSLSDDSREVGFLTGCIVLIRREVLEATGGLDPDYFFYVEDVDLCLRTRRAGFSLLYVPGAAAWHKVEDVARDRTSPFVMYHLARGQMLFLRKNFALPYVVYSVLFHLGVLTPFRLFQIYKGGQSLPSIRAWLRGTWEGLRYPRQSLHRISTPVVEVSR